MMFHTFKNRTKGFTLIELLVVIAIIGILSSVVLASLSTARQKSRDAKRISDVGQIKLALELFFDAQQSYPTTTPTLGTANYNGGIKQLEISAMLPKAPVPPNNGINWYRGIKGDNTEANGATDIATSYGVAVDLERTDNSTLSSDADNTVLSGLAGAYVANTASAPAVGGIGGKLIVDSQSCAAAKSGPEQCYDVKP